MVYRQTIYEIFFGKELKNNIQKYLDKAIDEYTKQKTAITSPESKKFSKISTIMAYVGKYNQTYQMNLHKETLEKYQSKLEDNGGDFYRTFDGDPMYQGLKDFIIADAHTRGNASTNVTEIINSAVVAQEQKKLAQQAYTIFSRRIIEGTLEAYSDDVHAIAKKDKIVDIYSNIEGIGSKISDETVATTLYRSKEIALQVALTYVSGGLANMATKGGMKLLSNISESVLAYYTGGRAALALGTKLAIGTTDIALEGTLFHIFNSSLSGERDKLLPTNRNNIKGYVHSMAFMGVMKAFGVANLQATERATTKLSALKLSKEAIGTMVKGLTIPLEIGGMMGSEQVVNLVFTQNLQEVTLASFLNTVALVLGLRMAHMGGSPFQKGEEIIVENMEMKADQLVDMKFECVNNKLEKGVSEQKKERLEKKIMQLSERKMNLENKKMMKHADNTQDTKDFENMTDDRKLEDILEISGFAQAYNNLKPGNKVLELGFGQGNIINGIKAKNPGVKTYGLDIRDIKNDGQTTTRQHDLKKGLPDGLNKLGLAQKNSVDFIYSSNALQYVENGINLIDQTYQALTPGGRAFLHIGFTGSIRGELAEKLDQLNAKGDITLFFLAHPNSDLKYIFVELLKKPGLTKIDIPPCESQKDIYRTNDAGEIIHEQNSQLRYRTRLASGNNNKDRPVFSLGDKKITHYTPPYIIQQLKALPFRELAKYSSQTMGDAIRQGAIEGKGISPLELDHIVESIKAISNDTDRLHVAEQILDISLLHDGKATLQGTAIIKACMSTNTIIKETILRDVGFTAVDINLLFKMGLLEYKGPPITSTGETKLPPKNIVPDTQDNTPPIPLSSQETQNKKTDNLADENVSTTLLKSESTAFSERESTSEEVNPAAFKNDGKTWDESFDGEKILFKKEAFTAADQNNVMSIIDSIVAEKILAKGALDESYIRDREKEFNSGLQLREENRDLTHELQKLTIKELKSFFRIVDESLGNARKYPNPSSDIKSCFKISVTPQSILIRTYNSFPNEYIDPKTKETVNAVTSLHRQIYTANTADIDNIKDMYKAVHDSKGMTHKGGGGLGRLEMRKISKRFGDESIYEWKITPSPSNPKNESTLDLTIKIHRSEESKKEEPLEKSGSEILTTQYAQNLEEKFAVTGEEGEECLQQMLALFGTINTRNTTYATDHGITIDKPLAAGMGSLGPMARMHIPKDVPQEKKHEHVLLLKDFDISLDRHGKGVEELVGLSELLAANSQISSVEFVQISTGKILSPTTSEGKKEIAQYLNASGGLDVKIVGIMRNSGADPDFGTKREFELFPEQEGNGLTNSGYENAYKTADVNIVTIRGEKIPLLSMEDAIDNFVINFLNENAENSLRGYTQSPKAKDALRLSSLYLFGLKLGKDVSLDGLKEIFQSTKTRYEAIPLSNRSSYVTRGLENIDKTMRLFDQMEAFEHVNKKYLTLRKGTQEINFLGQFHEYIRQHKLSLGNRFTAFRETMQPGEKLAIETEIDLLINYMHDINYQDKPNDYAYRYEIYRTYRDFIIPLKEMISLPDKNAIDRQFDIIKNNYPAQDIPSLHSFEKTILGGNNNP